MLKQQKVEALSKKKEDKNVEECLKLRTYPEPSRKLFFFAKQGV